MDLDYNTFGYSDTTAEDNSCGRCVIVPIRVSGVDEVIIDFSSIIQLGRIKSVAGMYFTQFDGPNSLIMGLGNGVTFAMPNFNSFFAALSLPCNDSPILKITTNPFAAISGWDLNAQLVITDYAVNPISHRIYTPS